MDDEKWERRIEIIKLVVPLVFAGLGVFLIAIALLQVTLSSRPSDRIIDKIFDASNNLILLGGGALTTGAIGMGGRKRGNITTVQQEFQQPIDNVIIPTPSTNSVISTSDYSQQDAIELPVVRPSNDGYDDEP
jgi:hypothetical protein